MRYPYTPTRITKFKKLAMSNVAKDTEKPELSLYQ